MKKEKKGIGLLLEAVKTLSGNSHCLYPNCSEPSIKSHIIPEPVLELFAEQNKVLMWNPKENDLISNARDGETVERIYETLRCVGIRNEVNWPLFCSSHDSAVFKPIEDRERGIRPDDEQVVLYAYRALCYKTYNPHLKELVELLLALESQEKVAENTLLFAIEPLVEARKRLENMVEGNNYRTLRWTSALIPMTPFIACADAFIPITEDEDKNIQRGTVSLAGDDVMTFTIFPKNQEETLCVITWFEGSKRGSTYGASLKSFSQEELYQFLTATAFTQSNIFISPVLWRSLSNEDRYYLTGLQLGDMQATRNLQKDQ